MHPTGSLWKEYDFLSLLFFFFPPSDLFCLRSSRSKYNTSTINYMLVFFFSLHFNLKKNPQKTNLDQIIFFTHLLIVFLIDSVLVLICRYFSMYCVVRKYVSPW